VKLSSALKNTDTDLLIGIQTQRVITWIQGLADHPQFAIKYLIIDIQNRRMSPILDQHHIKIAVFTDVVLMTRKDLAAASFKHQ
jgi:hypothetical protein